MSKVLAIVGMCGSGKSVACEYLEKVGFKKVYFGGVTLDELKKAGLEDTPENEKKMRESLREKYGMGAFAHLLLPKIKELSKTNDVVLDGLYSWDELICLNKEIENLKVIAIICDKNIRYERISKRAIRPLTKEEARLRDIAEIENLKKGGPIAFADYYLYNNGDMEEYETSLKNILKEV